MRKTFALTGGVHPPENKLQSLQLGIGELPLPDTVVIPLQQHIGAPAKPLVNIGDAVLKGQKIAEPGGFVSAAVHASTSGHVSAIGHHPVPHPSGMTQLCITISCDGKDEWIEHSGIENYVTAEPTLLLERIRDAGIVGMGGAGFPSAVKLATDRAIDTLIINGTECEPYITADDVLMQAHADEVIAGVRVLAHILGNPETVLIGVEDNKPEAFEALQTALLNAQQDGTQLPNIEIVDFPTRYPSGGEKQLIQILTGKEVPSGSLPAELGIVCQNIGTCRAIYRAVAFGEPLISRITTVVGEACDTQRNYYTLIGTPVSHVLNHSGFHTDKCHRLVMGGPMMGFTLNDTSVPVVKTTNCLLAATEKELPTPPPAQACIRCGMCAEACPASLLPQQLLWYAQSQNHEKLEAHNLFDCIECGACSYVCPSNIPLVQYYRAAKGEINQHRKDAVKSERARQRFEFQQERKEKVEAEKAAKKEERRLAAQKAKAKAGTNEGKADDLIQAAMARVASKKAEETPEQQRAKLERLLNSAENRLKVAEEKLAVQEESGTSEQQEQAKAKVEAARLKLADARKKLAELDSDAASNTQNNTAQTTEKVQTAENEGSAAPAATPPVAPQLTPEQQQSKLERLASSAEKRLKSAEEKLQAAESEGSAEDLAKLKDSVEKCRGKLQEAQQKLTVFLSGATASAKPATEQTSAAPTPAAPIPAAPQLTPEQERSKLERLAASAEKRLKAAEEKLLTAKDNGSEEEQQAAQEKCDAARKKQQDAATKLKEFNAQTTVDGN